MIPDRSQAMRRNSLTMLCYQEMPMIPKATNMAQAKVVAENKDLPEGKTIKRGRPKLAVPKPRPVKGTRSKTVKEKHDARIVEEVQKAFAKGPITIETLMKLYKLKSRPTANAKMNFWRKRGLAKVVGEVFTQAKPGVCGGYPRLAKLWGPA